MPEEMNLNVDESVENTETEAEETDNQESEDKTYTQAELDSQISKSVESALKRQARKNQAAIDAAVAKAVKEAEERAKMSDEERISADLVAREKALADREAQAERKEFLAEVTGELSALGIPVSFAELIVNSSSKDNADELIQAVKDEWNSSLAQKIKASARQEDPKAAATTPTSDSGELSEYAAEIRKI